MNKCMEIEVLGGLGEDSFEFSFPSGCEISIESGHAIEAEMPESNAEASIVCGGIVPEGSAFEWEQSMEFTSVDFAFVYIGPALEDTSSTDAWFLNDGWFESEGW